MLINKDSLICRIERIINWVNFYIKKARRSVILLNLNGTAHICVVDYLDKISPVIIWTYFLD